ncbi:hypothetical protein TNCV_415611 [Trichonephila clavipes]|nr:hypothetical protein TNCV_415611 [Trichonephila clavipes]
MIVQFRNEKVSNHGSIPITIDCNVVAFIVFEEGFHQPIKRTKQDLEMEVNEYDIEELIMGHEDELTTEELQEILNEEHQETQRNESPSEQEED